MIAIVCSLVSCQVVDVLLKGSKFNTHHHASDIMQPLPDWHVGELGATDRKLIATC
jgi:hypothetical protein